MKMRSFVREGKRQKRYKILSKQRVEMLRIYLSKYIQNKRRGRTFLSESGAVINSRSDKRMFK